jgi:hypothetical protein
MWYQPEAFYDKEIGNGLVMYSVTGLIPEYVTFADFQKDGMPLLRSLLADDMYFGNKAFVTCYCDESFRPKLPSMVQLIKEKQAQEQQESKKADFSTENELNQEP